MSDLSSQQSPAVAGAGGESRRPKSERRARPLTAEITAARDRRRAELIEDLYARLGIDQEPGDLGEAHRISLLRGRLGM